MGQMSDLSRLEDSIIATYPAKEVLEARAELARYRFAICL